MYFINFMRKITFYILKCKSVAIRSDFFHWIELVYFILDSLVVLVWRYWNNMEPLFSFLVYSFYLTTLDFPACWWNSTLIFSHWVFVCPLRHYPLLRLRAVPAPLFISLHFSECSHQLECVYRWSRSFLKTKLIAADIPLIVNIWNN